uniref:Uncharacterized protein n=1 Tax=Arundo donax TaxID=35708 RepID=A0A0A9DM74_ARUDO
MFSCATFPPHDLPCFMLLMCHGLLYVAHCLDLVREMTKKLSISPHQ